MSADTIIPDQYNPQNLNRYSYVRNNPLRYIDPTGHTVACNPMEDECHHDSSTTSTGTGSGTSQGSNHHNDDEDDDPDPNPTGVPAPSPIITAPTPTTPAINVTPVVNSTSAPPAMQTSSTQTSSNCPSCVVTGGALIISSGILEGLFGIAAVAAVFASGPAAIPGIALVIVPIEAVLGNVTLIGIEYVKQGLTRPSDQIDIDYLPMLHLFTNPDEGQYFP